MKRALIALACAGALAGCFRTTVINSDAGYPSPMYSNRWYHGFIVGIVDVSGPVDLDMVCPTGWARIDTRRSVLNSLVSALWLVYTPQTVTIYCNSEMTFDATVDGDGRVTRLKLHKP